VLAFAASVANVNCGWVPSQPLTFAEFTADAEGNARR
jgi:hypothetical protein